MRMTEKEFAEFMSKKHSDESKPRKHRNIKVYISADGIPFENRFDAEKSGKVLAVFDSKKEYFRWEELRMLQRCGEISELNRQVKWVITPKTEYRGQLVREIAYKADFQYKRNGETVVEDVKPFDEETQTYRLTKDFSLKWKLLKQKYPEILFELY